MKNIDTLSISLHHGLRPAQVGAFRKYMLSLSDLSEPLMHNHDPETGAPVARYPLVQYRIVRRHAAFFAINEGIPALRRFLDQSAAFVDEDEPSLWSQVAHLEEKTLRLGISGSMRTYRIYDYLPFDRAKPGRPANYDVWQNGCADIYERCRLLEHLLTNHIVAFCKSMDYIPEEQIRSSLQLIYKMRDVELHGNPFLCFNLKFNTNMLLPPGIALGKGVSHGFGVQYPFVPADRRHHTASQRKHTQSRKAAQSQIQAVDVPVPVNGHEGD